MKAVALALLVALPAFADDAPTAKCLEPSDRIALAQALTAKDTEIASLQKDVKNAPTTQVVVIAVAVALVAGVAGGVAVTSAVRK